MAATNTILRPDAILATSGLTGGLSDIQDDTTSPDANWMVAVDNNTDGDLYLSFPSPAGELRPGPQKLLVAARQFDEGQTGTPTIRLELWEAGSLVEVGASMGVVPGGGLFTLQWAADEVSDQSGAGIEIKIFLERTGGSPTKRNTIDIGAVEWECIHEEGVPADENPEALFFGSNW